MADPHLLSIVVPFYNEQDNLRPLYEQIRDVLEELPYDFELILVDDGSTDGGSEVARRLHAEDLRVKLISLSRNFGHQMALTAGIEHASGAAVISMDADLQHPPQVIPELIRKWEAGFEVVYTIREATEDAGLCKRWTSAIFYWFINCCVEMHIVPNAADFRLMDRKVVDCFKGMRERNRFVRGMTSWVGFKQTTVPFLAARRHAGHSKYTLRNMLRFALDGITSFSTVPLRFATYLGFGSAFLGVPYAVWALYARIVLGDTVPGWSSLIVAVLFLGGVQLICLGILGEYIGRIYEEVKGRPLYIARERLGFEPARQAAAQRKDDNGAFCEQGPSGDTSFSPHRQPPVSEEVSAY
uniref:Glycosyltransferase n=1 Tax=Schlesneria paludicola TaxID=360056 RepID=A0A7C4QTP6_9PLAN